MTTAKTKTKLAPEVFAECASCFRERRVESSVMCEHRRYTWLRMEPCPGSGQPPAESGLAD